MARRNNNPGPHSCKDTSPLCMEGPEGRPGENGDNGINGQNATITLNGNSCSELTIITADNTNCTINIPNEISAVAAGMGSGDGGTAFCPCTVGEKGDTGPKGDKGDNGAQGLKGDQGEKGSDGTPGTQGSLGSQGEKGDKGERGDKGDIGGTGKDGTPSAITVNGIPAPDGLDVGAIIYNNNGVIVYNNTDPTTASEMIIVYGVDGDIGATGRTGDSGEPGKPGPAGPEGDEGPVGKEGPVGPRGPEGPRGPKGAQGGQGPDGEDGKDGDPGTCFGQFKFNSVGNNTAINTLFADCTLTLIGNDANHTVPVFEITC